MRGYVGGLGLEKPPKNEKEEEEARERHDEDGVGVSRWNNSLKACQNLMEGEQRDGDVERGWEGR